MKTALAVACVSVLLMSCSGSDAAAPLTTDAPPATIETPTTAETTTTSTSTTSTTSTTTSTTVPEPIVTEVPPTDPDRVDVQGVGAEAFAGYEIGWLAFRNATTDPANQDLRDEVARYHANDSLESSLRILDSLVEQSFASVAGDGTTSFVSLLGTDIVGGDNFALIRVCEVIGDSVVNVESGDVVFDRTVAYTTLVELVRTDGVWVISEQVTQAEEEGAECS